MKLTIERYAVTIKASKYRQKSGSAMGTFLEDTKLRKMMHCDLEASSQDVLLRPTSDTFLLEMLNQSADLEKALQIAMEVILDFLEQPQSSASPSPGFPLAPVGKAE